MPLAEIGDAKNDFNLNLPRYIDSTSPEALQDIDAHLRGGIPERDLYALAAYWQVFPAVRAALFQEADRPGYSHQARENEVKRALLPLLNNDAQAVEDVWIDESPRVALSYCAIFPVTRL